MMKVPPGWVTYVRHPKVYLIPVPGTVGGASIECADDIAPPCTSSRILLRAPWWRSFQSSPPHPKGPADEIELGGKERGSAKGSMRHEVRAEECLPGIMKTVDNQAK